MVVSSCLDNTGWSSITSPGAAIGRLLRGRKGVREVQDLHNKVAFITGGASGIGLGIAMACVQAGMKAVLADMRQDHLDHALALFKQRGQEKSVHAIRLDVTDRTAYESAAA